MDVLDLEVKLDYFEQFWQHDDPLFTSHMSTSANLYMAPETKRKNGKTIGKYDIQAVVYSMGVLFHVMLHGKLTTSSSN